MAISTRLALRTTALAFSGALVLAACSNGGDGGGQANESGGATKTELATQVTVTETEYALKLSRTSFAPGTYTFTADNAGRAAHALEVEGPGVSEAETRTIQGGEKATVTVTLQKGSYELYCPVGGHKGLGMEQRIEVG
ncbi:plastocyanin/azurin family copper-binding protein [Streptomyces sp. NBC_00377]|uniref:plastocyanin/azurin family copper-binding protein n=1 Tax=unclassified Streptomyces TaxID=2593676 RepID=UPI002E23C412|nr:MULTISPECIES: plastocyanin/azurin family copper-binding protein [unclassified Streptomyces]